MKISTLIPALVILLGVTRLTADPLYEMDWSGLNAGGGTSQGGEIVHHGSIGGWARQPIHSANYSIVASYPLAPAAGSTTPPAFLRIVRIGESVRISWPAWAANFILEANPTMINGSAWNPVPGPVQASGDEVFVLAPASEACLFYRLTLN